MQRNAQGYKDGRSRDISTTTTVRSEPITQEVLSKEATKFNRIPETSIENVLEESFPSWAGKKKRESSLGLPTKKSRLALKLLSALMKRNEDGQNFPFLLCHKHEKNL